MRYIIMATDELGSEFRPDDREWRTYGAAAAELEAVQDNYPESRCWVERLRDSRYYARKFARMSEDELDRYEMEEC